MIYAEGTGPEWSTNSEVNQRLSITRGEREQQITLDAHGVLTAQITLNLHGNRAARGERGREEKKEEAQGQRREKDWYREGQNDQLGV